MRGESPGLFRRLRSLPGAVAAMAIEGYIAPKNGRDRPPLGDWDAR